MVGGFADGNKLGQHQCSCSVMLYLWVSKPTQYYYIHQRAYSAPKDPLAIFTGKGQKKGPGEGEMSGGGKGEGGRRQKEGRYENVRRV